jgi:polyphosphate kinase 2 (PPK2 family)
MITFPQAVNKLAEIMNRKDYNASKGKKVNASELRKKEKELRKIQQEFAQEKENFNKMVEKIRHELSEAQAALYDEGQKGIRLQMELDAKESEIEALMQKVALSQSADTVSLASANESEMTSIGGEDSFLGEEIKMCVLRF